MTYAPDDSFRRYLDQFYELWSTGGLVGDPSGWLGTRSDAAPLLPLIEIERKEFGRYYLDEGSALGSLKERILSLISAWEGSRPLTQENVTLYSSVSTATHAILVALKQRGVQEILFETPAYGVTIKQARNMGIFPRLLPTYQSSGFQAALPLPSSPRKLSCVLWLTQPRMSLGINQNVEALTEFLQALDSSSLVILDEATEQYFPSHLSLHSKVALDPRVIRVRGFLKGAGLNGIRLAFVLHQPDFRSELEDTQATLGASLGLYSLKMCAELATRPKLFCEILRVAQRQVNCVRTKAANATYGTGLSLSPIVNGYMGALAIPTGGKDRPNEAQKFRLELLEHCSREKIPLMLGPAMLFSDDSAWEYARINYFKPQAQIIAGIRSVNEFLSQS